MLAALAICILVRGWYPPFKFREGYVSQRDISARVSFNAVDPAETAAARDRARKQVRPIFVNNPALLDESIAALERDVREVLAAESYTALAPRLRTDFRFQILPDGTTPPPGQEGSKRFEDFRQALAGDKDLVNFHKQITAAITPLRERGAMSESSQKAGQSGPAEIVVYSNGKPDEQKVAKLADVQIGEGAALRETVERELVAPALSGPVFHWLWHRMSTNFSTLSRDDAATQAAVDKAVSEVQDVVVKYQAGQTLAPAGQPLSADKVRVLRQEYEYAMAKRSFAEDFELASAVMVTILAMFGLVAFYLYRYERRLLVSLKRLAGTLILVVLTVGLSIWATSVNLGRPELVPILLFGQTVAIAYRQELALLLSGLVALILAQFLGHGLVTLLLLMGVNTAAVLQVGRVRSRSKLVRVSVWTALVAFVLTLVLAVLENQLLDRSVVVLATWNAAWAIASGCLMTTLLPFIESVFGVLTDISLLELGDVSHPLLQELVRRAPSTYNHSITVGSIAEAAAEAIGVRGLLARVGAYYHDIGKMLKPGYFIENQSPEGNRHETLVPAMSTLVIIAHIKDGSDLARQHSLPEPLIDLIEQHHGTTLVEYFYGRASAQAQQDPNGSEVDESSYRYPGPKPQTKEAGVLMLADSVESASRTLVDPTPARIESLVREIAERKLDDGQFDESGLTLRELRTIENSMIKSLIANYHGRVKYPEKPIPVRAG